MNGRSHEQRPANASLGPRPPSKTHRLRVHTLVRVVSRHLVPLYGSLLRALGVSVTPLAEERKYYRKYGLTVR